MYSYMYALLHTHVHTCMYVCMYTYIHLYRSCRVGGQLVELTTTPIHPSIHVSTHPSNTLFFKQICRIISSTLRCKGFRLCVCSKDLLLGNPLCAHRHHVMHYTCMYSPCMVNHNGQAHDHRRAWHFAAALVFWHVFWAALTLLFEIEVRAGGS